LEFPRRIYTVKEVMKARECVNNGYKHRLTVIGSNDFKEKIKRIKSLLRITDYFDFFRTYIRTIQEIDGISQLRETEATIWLNDVLARKPCDGARFVIQKAYQMQDYLAGKQFYEKGEMAAIEKSLEFLRLLQEKRITDDLKQQCKLILDQWTDDQVL
jgi:hypothetical protein